MKLRLILAVLPLLAACGLSNDARQGTALLSGFTARLASILSFVETRGDRIDGGRITAATQPDAPALAQNWRRAEANLYLKANGTREENAEFLFPATQAQSTRIVLNSLADDDISAKVSCNGSAQIFGLEATPVFVRANRPRRFELPAGSHEKVALKFGADVTECTLSYGDTHQINLKREDLARPDLARLDAEETSCTSPDPARMDALQTVFYADRWMSQTCVQPTGRTRFLEAPLLALNGRIEALTGAPITEARLRQGNPDMALDFSRAPKLDLVYVSYLLMRADFSGYLMQRMLAHHAAQGTIVRILVTDKLMLDQDRALFEGLAADYPNVQIQYFVWNRPGLKGPGELIDTLQRSHHIKVFATLSSEPGRSRFITGGRNIWDGFFFDHPFDLSAYPNLRTYDENGAQGLMYYSIYADFEVEMRGDQVVRDFMAHLSTFWHRDQRTQVARPMAIETTIGGRPRDGQARHFMSLPWADNQAQEVYFEELFDAAEHDITIVTPFMYPTPRIVNAMLRARARGVKVLVVARVNSTDPSGKFITALNHGFVKNFADDFEVYDFVPGARMMHTKLILIDERLAVVTSSNMNRRSFLHDSENGIVFMDRAMTARLRKVVDRYLETATRQVPGADLPPFDRVMNELTDIWQYF